MPNFCSHMPFVGIYFLPCSTMRVNNNSRHLFTRQVSVCCYNVNGLFNRLDGSRICKLDNPEFTKVLKNDIIILTETHACKNDILSLDGYTCISNCRSEMHSRLRGGVAVFIRRTIKIGVKIVDTSHTDLIWIKLCRKFFKLKKDLHIGGIYISPASSNYTKRTNVDKTLFDKLESDIIKFQQNSSVLLLGDLNAHISSDDLDFIYNEEDDVASKVLPGNYGIDNMHTFRNTSIHQSTNEYGKNVLELCIGLQLRILNGRTIGDTVGRPTFHGYNGSSIDD